MDELNGLWVLQIIGNTFIYPRITRVIFSENGLIKEHRDYCGFCGLTFGPGYILCSIYKMTLCETSILHLIILK